MFSPNFSPDSRAILFVPLLDLKHPNIRRLQDGLQRDLRTCTISRRGFIVAGRGAGGSPEQAFRLQSCIHSCNVESCILLRMVLVVLRLFFTILKQRWDFYRFSTSLLISVLLPFYAKTAELLHYPHPTHGPRPGSAEGPRIECRREG